MRCVYRFLDKNGEILYIGATKNFKARMGQHFSANGHLGSVFYKSVDRVEYLEINGNLRYIDIEAYLITKYNPKHNRIKPTYVIDDEEKKVADEGVWKAKSETEIGKSKDKRVLFKRPNTKIIVRNEHNQIIGRYNTIKEASEVNGVAVSQVLDSCKGRICYVKGLRFDYDDTKLKIAREILNDSEFKTWWDLLDSVNSEYKGFCVHKNEIKNIMMSYYYEVAEDSVRKASERLVSKLVDNGLLFNRKGTKIYSNKPFDRFFGLDENKTLELLNEIRNIKNNIEFLKKEDIFNILSKYKFNEDILHDKSEPKSGGN